MNGSSAWNLGASIPAGFDVRASDLELLDGLFVEIIFELVCVKPRAARKLVGG